MAITSQVEEWNNDVASKKLSGALDQLSNSLFEPAEFIQNLATQTQLIACLKWLCEFQVLACIPLMGSMPTKEVADLAEVPEGQLCRVVRLMATTGFLFEPVPGQISHTALSAPFVTDLSLLDASTFLSETAAPTALQATALTKKHGTSPPKESAYSVAAGTKNDFEADCLEQPRLHRKWAAYCQYTGDVTNTTIDVLSRLNWRSLGKVTIVDTCADSLDVTMSLVESYPNLKFVVQTSDKAALELQLNGNKDADEEKDDEDDEDDDEDDDEEDEPKLSSSARSRITLQERKPAAAQNVKNAAVYMLRLPSPSRTLSAQILAELKAHLNVLRTNSSSTLILAPSILPEPGILDSNVEAKARVRDMSRRQMTNEGSIEVSELLELVSRVRDSKGGLVVVNKLCARGSAATAALGIKYELDEDDDERMDG